MRQVYTENNREDIFHNLYAINRKEWSGNTHPRHGNSFLAIQGHYLYPAAKKISII